MWWIRRLYNYVNYWWLFRTWWGQNRILCQRVEQLAQYAHEVTRERDQYREFAQLMQFKRTAKE